MKIKKYPAAVFAAALLGGPCFAVLGGTAPTFAHCEGSATVASSSSAGREYNDNAVTCNGDKQYTGRFEDFSTSVSIRMRWDLDQNGTYDAYSPNSSSNVADTISGLLWNYNNDSDSASWFQICHTNGSGGVIACASRGTNSGY